MRSLTSIAMIVLAAAAVAQADDQDYHGANIKLMAAKKTYLLGDGKYFDSTSVTSLVQFDSSYVTLGNKEVQGFQKITAVDQTQSLPSWQWNTTCGYEVCPNGIASIQSVAIANQFYWVGNSVVNPKDGKTYVPFGLADANTGKQAWMQWVEDCAPTTYPFNSTHLMANVYGCSTSPQDVRQYSTINLVTKGYIVNLTVIPEYIDVAAASVVPAWGGVSVFTVTGSVMANDGKILSSLFAWTAASQVNSIAILMNKTRAEISTPITVAGSILRPSNMKILLLKTGSSLTEVICNGNGATFSMGGKIDFVVTVSPWSLNYVAFVSGAGEDMVVSLTSAGKLKSQKIGASQVTLNWSVGPSSNMDRFGLLGAGLTMSTLGTTDGSIFFVNANPSPSRNRFFKTNWKSTTEPTVEQSTVFATKALLIQAGTCYSTGNGQAVCQTNTLTNSFPMIATVGVQAMKGSAGADRGMWPVMTSVYQPLTASGAASMQLISGSAYPVLAEGGVISELGALAQDQYDFVTEQPSSGITMSGNTLVWYNSTTIVGWSMTTNSLSMISNVWNTTNFTISSILGATDSTIFVLVQASVSGMVNPTKVPSGTQFICSVNTNQDATWTNTFAMSRCFRLDNFATCGMDAGIAAGAPAQMTVVGSDLWFVLGGQCLVCLNSNLQAKGLLFATYYYKALLITDNKPTPAICNDNNATCNENWVYGTIKAFSMGRSADVMATLAVTPTSSGGSSVFALDQVVSVKLSELSIGSVYRGGTPMPRTPLDKLKYWQLGSGAGFGSGSSARTTNFAPLAIVPASFSGYNVINSNILWNEGYWYFSATRSGSSSSMATLYCYQTINVITGYSAPVWSKAMDGSTTATKVYFFQQLIYLEGSNSIAAFVPQQAGSQIGVKMWEGPSANTKVSHLVDGSVVLTDGKYLSSFSFLGKGNWESPMCYNGTRGTSSAGGSVANPSVIGSTVFASCIPSASPSTTCRGNTAIDLYTGNVLQRWNSQKGVEATFLAETSTSQYYFVSVGGNHSFTRLPTMTNKFKGAMATQYPTPALVPTPTAPISGLGIENWNASFGGLTIQRTDTGFGNVYMCGTNVSSPNPQSFVGAVSSATGALLWNISVPTCTGLKALGPVVMVQSTNMIKGVNAMTGRDLYSWVYIPMASTPNMVYCNPATIFWFNSQTLWYLSVASGKMYAVLDIRYQSEYNSQTFSPSVFTPVATGSSIIVTTQDFAFWVTAFGEVRSYKVSQVYGQTTAVSADPKGAFAVVVRTGNWQNDFPMFPKVDGVVPNSTTAVILSFATKSIVWTASIIPNQYARARKQTVQGASQSGVVNAIDWGTVNSVPVVLFIQSRWINAMYVTGTNAGTQAYATGKQFWWLQLAALTPVNVKKNVWYLTDERANFHTFDVNTGSFLSSFQMQLPDANGGWSAIYMPSLALVQGIAVTDTSMYIGWNTVSSTMTNSLSPQLSVFRVDLDKIGTSTPTEAFASVYQTVKPVVSIALVKGGNPDGTDTIVVVGKQQLSAVDFQKGEQIISYPGTSTSIGAWNYNKDLSLFYTTTNDGYAQCVTTNPGQFAWNVTLNSVAQPSKYPNTIGTEGYLTKDATKYIVTTNNASVCVFNAASTGTQKGAGFFPGVGSKKTCFDLRTDISAMGKQCTFTNQKDSLGAFITESGGNVFFASASSNCIFKIDLSAVAVTAIKFQYSYAFAPVSVDGNLFFSDGVYVYKLSASDFTASVGTAKATTVLAVGATEPFAFENSIYVGTTQGLMKMSSSDLTVMWNYATSSRIVMKPVFVGGNILVGDANGYIYAVTTSGMLSWKVIAGYNAANPSQVNTVSSPPLASVETGTFLWITINGIVAYDNNGATVWSDFMNRVDRRVASRYSFSTGRIFPIALNCQFKTTPDGKTLYAKCGPTLVSRDIATGQILFETGMAGARFAVQGATMTYPGNTKIVEQTIILPAIVTPTPAPPTYTPAPPNASNCGDYYTMKITCNMQPLCLWNSTTEMCGINPMPPTMPPTMPNQVWGYSAIMTARTFDQASFVAQLAAALGVMPATIKVTSVGASQLGFARVGFTFQGVNATIAQAAINRISQPSMAAAGIQSFSAVDTSTTPAGPSVIVNNKTHETAILVFLVLCFIVGLIGVVVLVVMVTKLGAARSVSGGGSNYPSQDDTLTVPAQKL